MLVSCVHPVAVLNAAFCMTWSLLMLGEDAMGDHMEEAYSRDGLMTTCCCCECFMMLSDFCASVAMFCMCVLYESFCV